MINFYNYYNFFLYNKKKISNVIISLWSSYTTYIIYRKFLIFSVIINSSKMDIKNSIEYFLGLKVFKVNTCIIKKKKNIKKAFIFFNDFI